MGIILLVVGVVLMASGASVMSSAPDPDVSDPDFSQQSSDAMRAHARGAGLIMAGFLMVGISLMIIYMTNIRRVTKYMATETAPAVEIVGGAAGRGIAHGTQEAGGIKFDTGSQGPREVVKVKCRKCGYLDTEDADFCSKCGGRL